MMGYIYRCGYPGYGGFTTLKLLIFLGVVIFIVKIIKNSNRDKNLNIYGNTNRAIEILKERYAAGEISEEQYKRKLEIIRS